MQIAGNIQKAANIQVDLDKEFKQLPKLGMNKMEIEEAKEIITNNRQEDGMQGENTLWKLAQGLGAVARNKKDETRKREIEAISGKLLEKAAKLKTDLVLS